MIVNQNPSWIGAPFTLLGLPPSLNTHQAMAIGTAGYTAMLSLLALERHGLAPDRSEVLVTGRPQESAFLERLVAACGLAQGMDFPATVAPFILRGVSLLGINSVTRLAEERRHAWARLAEDIEPALLDEISRDIRLSETLEAAERLLAGTVRGRLVVDVNG